VTVYAMVNTVMAYAWGSHDGISGLRNLAPSSGPEAELWMGAHPHASSVLIIDGEPVPLDAAIAADPLTYLGAPALEKFGARLPFLLKVLSAAQPLSLQVHPNPAQARLGFETEDNAGIDRSAPNRSYRDPYAKPEMIVALGRFEAMQGFRSAAEAAALLAAIDAPLLSDLTTALRSGLSTGEAFLRLVEWPMNERAGLVAQVAAGSAGAVGEPALEWIHRLTQAYPEDPGVVAPALLNYVALEPGQALLVAPGEIHAYLHGTGVEILGGSDNVIRGGLTPKHVSVGDLRAVLILESRPPAVADPLLFDGETSWPAPFDEFELTELVLAGERIELVQRGPELAGGVTPAVPLAAGESAFVTAVGAPTTATGIGRLMRATPKRSTR
jgi:mannose-6-phosphate isomerase